MKLKKGHTFSHYLITAFIAIIKSGIGSLLSIATVIVGFLIFQSKVNLYSILIGMPLLLIGIGLFVNSFANALLSLFSLRYNKGKCPLCN